MRASGAEAIDWCVQQSQGSTIDWSFHCLGMVNAAWDAGGSYPNAWYAWQRSTQHGPDQAVPEGAPVYWDLWATGNDGVRRQYGHIAVASSVAGMCWSIDIVRRGKIDHVPIGYISSRWGARFVGWSSDIEAGQLPLGITPHPTPPPPPVNGDDMPMTVWLSTDAPDGSDEETVNAQRWAWADFIGPFDGIIAGPVEWITAEYRSQLVSSGTWDRLPKKNRDRNNGYFSYRLLGAIPDEAAVGGPHSWSPADFRAVG